MFQQTPTNDVGELAGLVDDEAPNFKAYVCQGSHILVPHQKFVIIDGLMAFTGSANLTVSGWCKAATDREHIEVLTDIYKVAEYNNRYFAPFWDKMQPCDIQF